MRERRVRGRVRVGKSEGGRMRERRVRVRGRVGGKGEGGRVKEEGWGRVE